MGRLENIIARNQQPRGSRERLIVMFGFGIAILVIIVLMTFTDLGMPPVPTGASRAPVPAAGSDQRGQRVDGVLLRSPARAAQPAQPVQRQ